MDGSFLTFAIMDDRISPPGPAPQALVGEVRR